MQVGLVGLGRMGSAMAGRLAGFDIKPLAWDIQGQARSRAQAAGIAVEKDAQAVAAASDIVLTSITEDNGAHALYAGENGFLSGDVSGKLFIEMSTLRPQTARDLAALLQPRGASFIDSPVLGTIPSVTDGKLVALVGGAAGDLDRARPVLEKLAVKIVHMGGHGAGYAMKLANNLTMAAYVQAIGEGLAMGQAQGLDIDKMLEVIAASPLANGIFANKKGNFRGDGGPLTLDIRTLRKDIQSVTATGSGAGVPMPVASATLDMLASAVAAGLGGEDIGEIVPFIRNAMVQKF